MIEAFAPAKVNLALHITGQRDDGYHLLDSLVVFADIGDTLTFRASDRRSLTVAGPFADGVPTGPENLIWRAADLIDTERSVAIALEKRLPHGAGLGGGSSDAGAALRALIELWDAPGPSTDALVSVGADVPVAFGMEAARMQGIGEELSRTPPLPPAALLLVNPRVTVPTGQVFRGLADKANSAMEEPDWTCFDEFVTWCRRQRNDLQEPAIAHAPAIADVLRRLDEQPDCLLSRMSGSGATCFGLFTSLDQARIAGHAVASAQPDWWIEAAQIL